MKESDFLSVLHSLSASGDFPSFALFRLICRQLASCYEAGEAKAVCLWLLEEAFGLPRTAVYADKVRHFSQEDCGRLANMCRRLQGGEPVQYVVGAAWFCGRRFAVSPAVLIPRPETEELVNWAVAEAKAATAADAAQRSPFRLLDGGTGSGCIAVSMAKALPEAEVWAVDLSAEALAVARENAARLKADVKWLRHDLLRPWPDEVGTLDLIVSNPPYVLRRERADMEARVLDHEPEQALFVPDDDPLRFYRALAREAAKRLRPGGCLMVETNCALAREVARLFCQNGLKAPEVRRDAFGRERMVCARR